MSDWVDVAPLAELMPGSSRLVDLDDVLVAVFNVNGEIHAIQNVCTHDGFPLVGDGHADIVNGEEIRCPRHGARFCLRTGAATAPPAYEPVAVFPTRVVEGQIQVRDARFD
jgi:3-phenylpropionate/trans-cinnamate dioxygenase ferredoxin subunit